MNDKKRPDWVPDNAGKEFTTSVMKGVETSHDGMPGTSRIIKHTRPTPHRRHLNTEDFVAGVLNRDRTILARAITLIESNSSKHLDQAQEVLRQLLPYTGKSVRIGITGVPGAGKSTFIEALGMNLVKAGHRVAVLAVDPSSTVTHGSILGDKTRMEMLSREENCFIRPSPSAGALGGVTRKTRETALLCEASGFDVILVETVGVGQNEVTVRSMVDFFLLLKIAGAGDELQGIKKGVIELADAILINKADGDNILRAQVAREEFSRALHYLKTPTEGWLPRVLTSSALNNEGVTDVWDMILEFIEKIKENNVFNLRRDNQMISWIHALIKEHLEHSFYHNKNIIHMMPEIEKKVLSGDIPPTAAARELLKIFEHSMDE